MYYIVFMQVFDSFKDRPDNERDFRVREFLIFSPFSSHQVSQSTSRDVFHEQVDTCWSLLKLVKLDNIRMLN